MNLDMTWKALLGAVAGGALGLVFFGALWTTVQRLVRTRHPAAVALVSLTARLVFALGALYAIVRLAGVPGLVGAAVGMRLARTVLVRRLGTEPPRRRTQP
jgi:F1F0 ATPase subunit 2